MAQLGLAPDDANRMQTATTTQRLVEQLHTADSGNVIELLAKADVATSEAAMGECIGKAAELEGNLDTAGWQTFELVNKLPEAHQSTAKEIMAEVRQALS